MFVNTNTVETGASTHISLLKATVYGLLFNKYIIIIVHCGFALVENRDLMEDSDKPITTISELPAANSGLCFV